jgi:organic radical activating enzyme
MVMGKQAARHLSYCEEIAIGPDGRVCLPSLRFMLAYGCNLKCQLCHNSFFAGIVSKEEITGTFEKWSPKVSPRLIRLYGGEPLLNPDLAEITVAARRYWSQSSIQICSNGLLIPRLSDDTLRLLAESNAWFYISQHEDTNEYRDILKQSFLRFERFNIRYKSVGFFDRWRKAFETDSDGLPIPHHSDPQKAFDACNEVKRCVRVEGNFMYRCARIATLLRALDTGTVSPSPEWDRVRAYRGCSFQSTHEEIIRYLQSGPGPECSICPEKHTLVPFRQYTVEEIQHVKEIAQQRNRQTETVR